MSTSIEQRVVQMKFDNKQFESGVAQSISTLEKFKEQLNFKGASKSFEDISKAADQVSLENLVKQTDSVGNKFDTLAVIAISALNRITNEAITAGSKLVKSLSIDQVTSGWSKYEARTAAVQTLVNATGKSVEDIEKYMDKLMLYSDETSYGFADMTSALATMVSAGGDINKLVPLLEGFGNAVSFVGKGAAEYSRAVIQLSQGYGRNALMYEDWKSIEQTLGGAKQLREVFIDVAEELGKIEKGEVTIGNFNETLKDKWLDQEVMEKALGRFGEMTEKAFNMVEAGEAKNVAEAYEILSQSVDDYRIKAAKAAQEAKSFTEAIEATKDAVSTKWMESFQIIFGNYAEATELWTELTNTLWDLFAASGDTRNEILSVWRAFEGREAMIDAAKAAFEALYTPVQAVGDAINEIFFPGTIEEKGLWLVSATEAVRDFFESLKLSEEAVTTLRMGFKLLLIPVYAFSQVLRVIQTVIAQTIITLFALANALLTLPSRLANIENPLKRVFGDERYARIVEALSTIVTKLGDAFSEIGKSIVTIGKSIAIAFGSKILNSIVRLVEFMRPIAEWILDRIVEGFEYLASLDYSKIADWATWALESLIDGLSTIIGWCETGVKAVVGFFAQFFTMSPIEILYAIIDAVKTMKDNLIEFAKSLGFDKLLAILSEAGANVIKIVIALGKAIADFVGELTPAKILIFAFGVSMVWLFMNLSKAISMFTKLATKVVDAIGSVRGVLEAFQKRLKGSPILQAAFAIGVLAVSLGALAQLDSVKLIIAAGALVTVTAALVILMGLMAAINAFAVKSNTMASNLKKMSIAMLATSAAVALLASALALLGAVNLDGILPKLGILAGMLVALVVAVRAMSKSMEMTIGDAVYIVAFALSLNLMISALERINGASLNLTINNIITIGVIIAMMVALSTATKDLKLTAGLAMIGLATSLLLFALAIKPIANIDTVAALHALTNLILIFAPLAIISNLLKSTDTTNLGLNFAALAAGIFVMSIAIKAIGALNIADVAKGTAAVGAILVFIGIMNMLSKRKKEKETAELEGSFLALSAAILVLSTAIILLGQLDLASITKGTVAVVALLGMLTMLGKAIGQAQKATATVVALTVCIGLLVTSMAILSLLDSEELLASATALMLAFTGIGVMFKLIGEGMGSIKKAITTLILMAAALASVGTTLKLFDDYTKDTDPTALMAKAASLGTLLLTLGVSISVLGNKQVFKTSSWGKFLSILGTMVVVLAAVGTAVKLVDDYTKGTDPIALIAKAASLGIVLVTLGESIKLISEKSKELNNLGSVVVIIGALGLAAGLIVALLSNFVDPTDMLAKAAGFAAILAMLTGVVIAISLFSKQINNINKDGIAGLIMLGVVVSLLGVVSTALVGWLSTIPVDNSMIERAVSFSIVLTTVIGCIAILSLVNKGLAALGSAAGPALLGAGVVVLIIGALSAIFVAVGALFNEFSGLEGDLEKAEEIIPRIGALIGSFFGSIVSGVIDSSIGTLIENFGTHLSNFAENVQGFAQLNIPSELATSVATLGSALLTITGSEFLGALFTLRDEEGNKIDALTKFGEQLEEFAPHFVNFANSMADIPQDAVIASATCLESLAQVLANVPLDGGLMGIIFGNKNFEGFGTGLSKIAEGLSAYATSLKTVDVDDATLKKTENLTETLIKLADKLPKTGGLQKIFGESDFKKFGEQIKSYASSLSTYVSFCNSIALIYVEDNFNKTYKATEKMIELAEKVPESGVLVTFFGGQNIGTFGEQIAQFGTGINNFFTNLTSLGLSEGEINLAKTAGMAFVDIANALDPDKVKSGLFTGTSAFIQFADSLSKLGDGIKNLYNKVKDVKNWDSVNKAVNNIRDIAGLSTTIDRLNNNSATKFGTFTSQLASYGLTEFTTAFSNGTSLISTTVSNTLTTAISQATNQLYNSNVDFDGLIDAVLKGLEDRLEMTGSLLLDSLLAGFVNSQDDNNNAVADFAKSVIKIAKTMFDIKTDYSIEFEKIGQYCISGFIKGLDENMSLAETKVTDLGNRAIKTFEISLGVNSPSKKFAEIGMYSILGFKKGIEERSPEAIKSILKMGGDLLTSIKDFFGIHSPSLVMKKEVGVCLVDGITDGIASNTSAEETAAEKAEDIVTSFKDQMVTSIAEDKTAEKTAAQKAQDIISAFQNEFNKWSGEINLSDLEYKLWSTVNRDASEAEVRAREILNLESKLTAQAQRYSAAKAQFNAVSQTGDEDAIRDARATLLQEEITMRELTNELADMRNYLEQVNWTLDINTADLEKTLWETMNRNASEAETSNYQDEYLNKKLGYQAEIVAAAEDNYQKALAIYGETSDTTQEAYNTYIEAQTALWELANTIADNRGNSKEMYDAMLEQFNERMTYYKDVLHLIDQGQVTYEELLDWVKEEVNFDEIREARQRDLRGANTPEAIIAEAMSHVQGVIELPVTADPDEIFREYLGKASTSFDHVLAAAATGTSTGGTSGLTNATDIEKAIEETLNSVTGQFDLGDLADGMMGDWIDGIRNNLGGVGDALVGVAENGFTSLRNFFGLGKDGNATSDSNLLQKLGNSIMNLFGKGIEENTDVPVNATEAAVDAISSAAVKLPEDFEEIGKQTDEGLAAGIRDGLGSVKQAVAEVCQEALLTATTALAIHSPSRKYYYLGEMMNAGMAAGLVDSTSVVKQAVEDVLNDVNDFTESNAISASISPVIDGNASSTGYLKYNPNGEMIPQGYRGPDGSSWWTDQITTAIQQFSASEEERRIAEQTALAEYRETLDELKAAVRDMADKPSGVAFTQNNYSPTALTPSTIYRNTKTALARASAAASPTGRSLGSN